MSVSGPSADFNVLIVGAGATGLLIAQGLKKAGISAKVYERYPEQKYIERSGQWTMALHWSIPHIEACLPSQYFAQLKSAETNIFEEHDPDVAENIPILNGSTGELLATVLMPSPRRIVRGKLRDLFRQGIDVHFGQALTGLHVGPDGVTARFNNGETTAKGTVLIGADGARSAVRGHLVEGEVGQLSKANIMILSAFPTFTKDQALFIRSKSHPLVQLSPHPYHNTNVFSTVADIRDPDAPDTWVFQFTLSIWTDKNPPASEEERRHLFRAYLSTYCEPYRSVAAWLSEDTKISGEKFHYWGNIAPWTNHGGRVTLAGDAAHPMVPFRAQGLNNALEDARLYVDALKRVVYEGQDLKSNIKAYDDSTYKRGSMDIKLSNEQMYAYHHWDVVMNGPLMRGGYKKQKPGEQVYPN
ncbi:hypothetical protein ABOM_012040 [Aspergillus bombycis]|uniref:FAD-binding domain-containing protein n=1 Tax=Aspergillus bombycis TaxID=109264 RepID=A0A1F7ZJM3_9EURO|nr:hypothetical protein ABOM_012040 [Aspergillus bombycis]OGM39338.1 hypothetical protein ABOM_012040 [Aspergillus bombycis]